MPTLLPGENVHEGRARRPRRLVLLVAALGAVTCGPPSDGDGSEPPGEATSPEAGDSSRAVETRPPPLDTSRPPTLPTRAAAGNRPVWLEGGTFTMGTDDSYPARGPAHQVTVSGFWIQQHEVTNAEFRRFRPDHRSVDGPDDHPVEYVQWSDAMAYADWLGGGLPSEAQWEYAARGPEGRAYPWGESRPGCALAWYADCRPRGTLPVMSLPDGATPDGIYDLGGNVAEWVSDRYGPHDAAPVSDPVGPPVGDRRVLRGGGWQVDSTY